MNNRYSIGLLIERIQKFAPEMDGVFLFSDLCNLIGAKTEVQNTKVINRLIKEGVLKKIQKGIYTTLKPDLWVLASRLKKDAYVTMDSVLSKNALIGTVPEYSVSLAWTGRKKIVKTPFGLLRYFSIQKDLLFGIQTIRQGVRVADNEKAYLDLLYFYMKGARFVIDPLQEVTLEKLDIRKIKKYLKYYKNPKFIKFVKGLLHEFT